MADKTNYVDMTIENVRISYPFLFAPRKAQQTGDKDKYEVTILIPKSDTGAVNAIGAKVLQALPDNLKVGGKPAQGVTMPLKDGDLPNSQGNPRPEEYKGHWFITAKSQRAPMCVKKISGNVTGASEDDFYSGCWCHVNVTFAPYSTSGNRGVTTYLRAVCKAKDDERFGGSGPSAAEMFKDAPDTDTSQQDMPDWM